MDWQNLMNSLAPLRRQWDVAVLANLKPGEPGTRPVDLIKAINAQADDGRQLSWKVLEDTLKRLETGGYIARREMPGPRETRCWLLAPGGRLIQALALLDTWYHRNGNAGQHDAALGRLTDVTGERSQRQRQSPQAVVDLSKPNPARIYDALLDGKDNYAVDRDIADRLAAAKPSLRANVRANRRYLGRVTRYLAAEAGARQFLDLGTGLPSKDNTHEIAQRVAPDSRVVYVDHDPVVLTYARALLTSMPGGAIDYLHEDIRYPEIILARAAATLDFTKPIAVMFLGVLHMIPDSDRPYDIVARLMDALPPGSYLAVSHPASDIDAEAAAEAARQYEASLPATQTNRTREQVSKFFHGLDLLEPGIVQLPRWRPDPDELDPGIEISSWAGLARKP